MNMDRSWHIMTQVSRSWLSAEAPKCWTACEVELSLVTLRVKQTAISNTWGTRVILNMTASGTQLKSTPTLHWPSGLVTAWEMATARRWWSTPTTTRRQRTWDGAWCQWRTAPMDSLRLSMIHDMIPRRDNLWWVCNSILNACLEIILAVLDAMSPSWRLVAHTKMHKMPLRREPLQPWLCLLMHGLDWRLRCDMQRLQAESRLSEIFKSKLGCAQSLKRAFQGQLWTPVPAKLLVGRF